MNTETMPALVQFGLQPGQVELREVPIPPIGDHDVLLQVGAVGVCGSDIHQYLATPSWRVEVPVTLGHEFTGTVVDAGKQVSEFKSGDRVVSETAARICGRCAYCRSGNYNLCPRRQGYGAIIDGAMARYVRVPARCLHHIPSHLSFERAALTEPSCVAYTAVVERSNLNPGQSALILGPGPIGLLALLMARLQGASTTVVAGLSADAARLELAKKLGATHVVDLQRDDLGVLLESVGDGFGVDLVVDAAGAAASFRTAMSAVRPMGEIAKVGWGPGPLNASLDPIVQKAVTVNGSFSHNHATWERVIALLASGQLDVSPIVGIDAPLTGWLDTFERMHSGEVTKAILRP